MRNVRRVLLGVLRRRPEGKRRAGAAGSWPTNVAQFGNLCKDDRVRSEKEARTMTVL